MTKFRATIVTCLLMLAGIPLAEKLAVTNTSAWYTHYLYIIGHGGFIHWIVNAWTLLVLHNLFRWYRVIAAYAICVLEGYYLLPELPMVGASVFTCFFIGFATPYLWRKSRLTVGMTLALLTLTCILPGFAGVQHIASYSAGVVFSMAEGHIRKIKAYLNE